MVIHICIWEESDESEPDMSMLNIESDVAADASEDVEELAITIPAISIDEADEADAEDIVIMAVVIEERGVDDIVMWEEETTPPMSIEELDVAISIPLMSIEELDVAISIPLISILRKVSFCCCLVL